MNRFLCFITGGHRYKDIDGKASENGKEMIFTHTCCKCGMRKIIKVPYKSLFSPEELKIIGYLEGDKR